MKKNRETKTGDDRFFSWKFLFYTLVLFWPLSVYGYCRAKRLMKQYGVKNWGGMVRNWYIGTAVVMVPVMTFLWWMAYWYIVYYVN